MTVTAESRPTIYQQIGDLGKRVGLLEEKVYNHSNENDDDLHRLWGWIRVLGEAVGIKVEPQKVPNEYSNQGVESERITANTLAVAMDAAIDLLARTADYTGTDPGAAKQLRFHANTLRSARERARDL